LAAQSRGGIDEDQGRSGSTAVYRTGFQRLAAEVGLGKVGIVLPWERFRTIIDRFLPLPRILHPDPALRFAVRHPR